MDTIERLIENLENVSKSIDYFPSPEAHFNHVAKYCQTMALLLIAKRLECKHRFTVTHGGQKFEHGEVVDDIREYCTDCGEEVC
jgi:hypothetical protein